MIRRILAVAALAAAATLASCALLDVTRESFAPGSFEPVAQVLRHPRCLNCHPSGDRPHVGDDARVHPQNVQRGPDDHGVPGLQCSACHRAVNQPLAGVPGAPHWGLAPRSMGWEGLDDHDLARALVDPARNGGRSHDDLIEHMAHDPLVAWGWDPGPGREAIPMERDTFVAAFRSWIEAGAPAPEPGTTTTF